jgi:cation transport regulator ChaC
VPSEIGRAPGDRWIFGYGSLVWRPDFPFREAEAASIRGWARRFWQGSTDHRGVPAAPGRVVTLVREWSAVCWGRAFLVAAADVEAVLATLDQREQGGYERHELDLHLASGSTVRGLVWVATEANRNYLGPAPLAEIAAQIKSARGPSGANVEYVLELARALAAMEAEDPHVTALARLLDGDA